MEILRHIPPGGNWKDVPDSVSCARLETIRASFARGEGSRSTYYGRLSASAPSYTINTYFSRPGNGCHLHYSQNRVMSQREAARFQSFPDDFEFMGPQGSVNKQIGNAVAPLLAYQVAQAQGEPGVFLDLFSGAGGLSLGFKWAGWKPLVANDIEKHFLATYAHNIHESVVLGDIREPAVRESIVRQATAERKRHRDVPFLVLGGPPCQGFSTAGKRRSMDDERNHLFLDYRDVVQEVGADGFIFENVTGLLNMQKGKVFEDISGVLAESMSDLRADVLKSEHFGIPQRRWRVFVVARREGKAPLPPEPVSMYPPDAAEEKGMAVTPGARDAIGDLPRLKPKQDGSRRKLKEPSSDFQRYARGQLAPDEYLARLAGVSKPGLLLDVA